MAKDLSISVLLDFYGDMLTEKQKDVVELYYNEDLSLAEIAEHSGITRQGVRDSIKRAEAQLKEYEERLGLAKRFNAMGEGLEEIQRLAREASAANRRRSNDVDVERRLIEIGTIAARLGDM
jgi:predicted DNA-binding protein YlxM (UPF0122 family)